MNWSENRKWLAALLIIGVLATPLIVVSITLLIQETEAVNPFADLFANLEIQRPIEIYGNNRLDNLCANPGQDGLSWETAYVLENFTIDMENRSDSGIYLENTNRCLVIRNVCI